MIPILLTFGIAALGMLGAAAFAIYWPCTRDDNEVGL